MMGDGYVYLIGYDGEPGVYKIGSTRSSDIGKRMRALQTSSPKKLVLAESFKTGKPFRLEHMLHRVFSENRLEGEWFELGEDAACRFREQCVKYQRIIDSLESNPFY